MSAGQLELLQAVSTEVAAALDPVHLAHLVVAHLTARFSYEFTSVYFVQADGRLHLAGQQGYDKPIQEFAPRTGVLGRVVQTRRSALVHDVAADPDFVRADPDIVAKVSVPILGDGRVLGVLNVESCRARGLGASDVRLLELLAQMMAVSLRNAELHAAAQRRAQELLIVQRISAQVGALREPDELAELVTRELRQELGYPLVAIYFLDERAKQRWRLPPATPRRRSPDSIRPAG